MKPPFADAFYYIALLNHADEFHPAALSAFESLQAGVVTTSAVLVEVADALSHPSMRRHVNAFLEGLPADATTQIVYVGAEWFEKGRALFASRQDKSWSLTDCISFVVMEQEGLTDALTGDRHFVQAGFTALL